MRRAPLVWSKDITPKALLQGLLSLPKKKKTQKQGRAIHEVQTVNWNTGIFEVESA